MRLIKLGCPEDEYSPEIGSILNSLKTGQTKDEVKEIVFSTFGYWFGEDIAKRSEKDLKK